MARAAKPREQKRRKNPAKTSEKEIHDGAGGASQACRSELFRQGEIGSNTAPRNGN